MMIELPILEFTLAEWQEHDFYVVKEAEKKLIAIARNGGTSSPAFENSCDQLRAAAKRPSHHALFNALNRPVDVRAFTYLLGSSDDFARSVFVSGVLLEHLLSVRAPMSRLSLMQLIRAFFTRFDKISSGQDLADLCKFIRLQLQAMSFPDGESDLTRYAHFADTLFVPDGPARVVANAKNENLDLDLVQKRLGLTGFNDGRFITLCRYQYYLKTLADLQVGEDDPVLTEISKREVFNAPYTQDKLLGHAVLEILIDRSAGGKLSQTWQKAILTIAGDPRAIKSNPRYQQWWALLGDKRISLMRGWLSRFDLKIFLEILEQSAIEGKNSSMQRMFASRKVFMEGLLEQGVVLDSRLFLSRYAESYLEKNYKKDELPEFATVDSRDTSMIYLNLRGKVHMLEGSHSFKIKLFDRLPKQAEILDYEITHFKDRYLRTILAEQYAAQFQSYEGCPDYAHDTGLNWQHKSIKFIQDQGVKLDVAGLIGSERYRQYKQMYGA